MKCMKKGAVEMEDVLNRQLEHWESTYAEEPYLYGDVMPRKGHCNYSRPMTYVKSLNSGVATVETRCFSRSAVL